MWCNAFLHQRQVGSKGLKSCSQHTSLCTASFECYINMSWDRGMEEDLQVLYRGVNGSAWIACPSVCFWRIIAQRKHMTLGRRVLQCAYWKWPRAKQEMRDIRLEIVISEHPHACKRELGHQLTTHWAPLYPSRSHGLPNVDRLRSAQYERCR